MKMIHSLFLCVILTLPLAVYAQDESNNTVHVIQPGENLFRIAQQYGLTVDELANANTIIDPTRIFYGQTLIIPSDNSVVEVVDATSAELPTQPNASLSNTTTSTTQTTPIYHTIQRGETLRGIAQQYGITEATLTENNQIINPNRILAGQQLFIGNETIEIANPQTSPDTTTASTEANAEVAPIIHTVQPGEYASAIARRYAVDVNLLIAANQLADPNQLLVGQQLVIPNGANETAIANILYPEPGAVVKTGREIVVDLSNSRVYAYENGILLYEAVSSNGLPATPTVQGSFTVRSKVRSQTMSGPGYWLPNVEWVLYFYQGYALHGTYWHNNFGQPMSHGCVNLTNEDARWFYDFAEIGTPVTVRV